MSPTLTAAERRDLKARAHALHPIVMIGNDGLTPAVLKAIDEALRSHELVKIRAATADRDGREALLADIAEQTGASPVQHIGKMLVVWRKRPPEDEAPEPKPRRPFARPRAKAKKVAAKVSRTARAGRPPAEAAPRAAGALGPARPGRAPRMLPKRGRPTRSGRR